MEFTRSPSRPIDFDINFVLSFFFKKNVTCLSFISNGLTTLNNLRKFICLEFWLRVNIKSWINYNFRQNRIHTKLEYALIRKITVPYTPSVNFFCSLPHLPNENIVNKNRRKSGIILM